MGCCGGNGKIAKIGSIASGYANKALHDIFFVRGELSDKADVRMAICRACHEQTWMKKAAYKAWLLKNGIEVLKNLDNLTALPPLDKQDYAQGRSMFCRQCKCWLPAKVYSVAERCPVGKW